MPMPRQTLSLRAIDAEFLSKQSERLRVLVECAQALRCVMTSTTPPLDETTATRAYRALLNDWIRATANDLRDRGVHVAHTCDEHCVLDETDACVVCGVYHGDACACGGRGYHRRGCERA